MGSQKSQTQLSNWTNRRGRTRNGPVHRTAEKLADVAEMKEEMMSQITEDHGKDEGFSCDH